MWELSADNALDYLHGQGWLPASTTARVEALPGGVSNAVLRVELDGSRMNLTGAFDAGRLILAGGYSTVRGLVINGYTDGIGIELKTQGHNRIQGNFIGTDVSGSVATDPTIDFAVADGGREIPIEERAPEEVATIAGLTADGRIETVRLVPAGSAVANYGFDVTPARLVTGLITERGILTASRESLRLAFAERAAAAE